MNKFFYLTIFTLLSIALLYYMLAEVISPYDSNNLLNVQNLMVANFLIVIALASTLALVHSIVDKLFFLKFYESPRIKLGYRRGIIITLTILSTINIRIFGIEEPISYLLILLLGFMIEAFFTLVSKDRKQLPKQNTTNLS